MWCWENKLHGYLIKLKLDKELICGVEKINYMDI